MSTTRATLRTRVLANLEGRSDTAMVTAVDAGLDEACEVLSAWEWREMGARTDSYGTYGYVGAWTTGDAYVVGEIVKNTLYYRCLTAHTAGTFATDLACYRWVLSSLAEAAYVTVTGLGELYRVQVIDGTSSYTVEVRTKLAVEDMMPVAEEQSAQKPTVCYREGDRIYFAAVPDAVYPLRVHYRKILSLASGASDTLSIDGFDSLVCAYATGYAYLAVRHAPKHAAEWTARFAALAEQKRQGQGHNGTAEGMDLRCSPSDSAGYYDQTQRGIDPLIVRFRGGAS